MIAFAKTDEELFSRYRDDDCQESIAELFRRYNRMLFHRFMVKRRLPETHVEDILQLVWFRVHVYRHSFDCSRKFSSWIFTVAERLAFHYFAKEREKHDARPLVTKDGEPIEYADAKQQQPSEICETADQEQFVQSKLSLLKKRDAQALRRYFIDQASTLDLIPEFGVRSRKGVQMRIKSAVQHLREQLGLEPGTAFRINTNRRTERANQSRGDHANDY